MEKIGVTFTERSWKDFLDFLRDVKEPESEDNKTNAFVDAYYKQTKAEEVANTKVYNSKRSRDASATYDAILEILEEGIAGDAGHIRSMLNSKYNISVIPKAFSGVMQRAMRRHPAIIKVDRGTYGIDGDRYEE